LNPQNQGKVMRNKLEQLSDMTTIVVDTGDIDAIKKFKPTDATTNPSLILAAAQKPQYSHLIESAIRDTKNDPESLMDVLFVNFGVEILKLIPGRVSTEVDARLSFDVEGSIQKALNFIELYRKKGIDKERVLIKLASTWEGGIAAKKLESMGVHCNMTLMFSMAQAVHCADAKATLISPFVGRILDWYKIKEKVDSYAPDKDPGVISVTQIYEYYKNKGIKTQIMGASFRNIDEILHLAGCDLLTISPALLDELQNSKGEVQRCLDPSKNSNKSLKTISMDESTFRFMLNDDAMATEKLAEGIRNFAKDSLKLESEIKLRMK
jgi:transaldolase